MRDDESLRKLEILSLEVEIFGYVFRLIFIPFLSTQFYAVKCRPDRLWLSTIRWTKNCPRKSNVPYIIPRPLRVAGLIVYLKESS